ncbi:glycosyltransferase family 2 protein [Oscillibacter sp.]|uniref:glycosyltransferase family 2 protein n=1 Tax=Oscillibacter sp. TaxID=1945593 RepID=UPI00289E66DB|nr:glycosyltransferase family 2 protein [Oscillibacter sp.]
MKTISVVVPTYNEETNVKEVYCRVNNVFEEQLPDYRCNLMFIDNCSKDKTRELITRLCEEDKTVTSIFNAKNFGFNRSLFYGLSQAPGDCAVLMFADMQDPPEMIPAFVSEWENGYKIVAGIKSKSKENPFKYFLRKCYYHVIKNISEIDHINQFDGFGLYDHSFIEVIREMDDSLPYLRGIIAELGFQRKDVTYEQVTRKNGKSSFNFMALYDLAMLGITSYSKVIMHIATIIGACVSGLSFLVAIYTLVMKLLNWNTFPFGSAATQVGIFLLGSLQLFFIGLVGEYIVNINTRVMHHPLVIEEQRINFDKLSELMKEESTLE